MQGCPAPDAWLAPRRPRPRRSPRGCGAAALLAPRVSRSGCGLAPPLAPRVSRSGCALPALLVPVVPPRRVVVGFRPPVWVVSGPVGCGWGLVGSGWVGSGWVASSPLGCGGVGCGGVGWGGVGWGWVALGCLPSGARRLRLPPMTMGVIVTTGGPVSPCVVSTI